MLVQIVLQYKHVCCCLKGQLPTVCKQDIHLLKINAPGRQSAWLAGKRSLAGHKLVLVHTDLQHMRVQLPINTAADNPANISSTC